MRTNQILTTLLVAALGAAAGCAPDASEDDPNAVAADQSTDEARAAWTRFVGAWSGTGSAFTTLVFTQTSETSGHHFFGEQQVVCVRAPCNPVRHEGFFSAGTRYLTLTVDGDATRYTYTLRGDSLTLTRGGVTVASLHRVESYCRDEADAREVCAEQGLITPRCWGHWACTSESRCSYACGPAGGEVGATCGGIAAIPCATGLRCVLDGSFPDASGTCRAVAGAGEHCGGNTRFPPVCADGLHCVLAVSTPDVGGTCQPDVAPFCPTARCAAGTTCCESARACQPAGLLCRL